MSMISDDALDAALDHIGDNVENLYICSTEPTTYTEAQTTYKLGTKATPTVNVAEDGDTSGRKRTVAAITDGSVDATGTAGFWALTDNSLTELLAVGPLSTTEDVTIGNTFTLTAFDIEFPDPA